MAEPGKNYLRAKECIAFLLLHGLISRSQQKKIEYKLNDKSRAAHLLSDAIAKLKQEDTK